MTTPKAKFAGLALIVALCAGFTLGLTAPAWAGWDEGWDAYKRRDYVTASREFLALAEQGNARAQVTLTIMLMFDEAVSDDGEPWDLDRLHDTVRKWLFERDAPNEQNLNEAVKWFRNGANQGDTKAWTLLGHMYGEGYGVPKDFDQAMKLWLKAAEQGEVTAQKSLALTLAFQNKETESENWIRKAAEQGDRWGQLALGKSHSHGNPADKLLAYMWLDLAAAQGSRRAAHARDQVAYKMYPDQIAEAKKLAQEWREKHKSGEAQAVAVYLPPKPEGDGAPRCLTGATFGPIAEDSPLFGGVLRIHVVDVERDSLAWKKGLREYDAVVMVNGELVRDLDEFAAATRKRGGSLILKILSRSFTRAWRYIGSGFFSVVC